jgi:AcrR family transcriptional regulator
MDKTGEMSARPAARDAIMDAFRDIILEGGYEKARVLDVVERSGVARSTFYEHFQGRDELVRDSVRGIFELLAGLAEPSCDIARITRVLEHVAEKRALVKSLMFDPGTDVLVSVFSEIIEERTRVSTLAARAVAGAQMAVLSSWLDSEDARDASLIAQSMREMSLALLRATLP